MLCPVGLDYPFRKYCQKVELVRVIYDLKASLTLGEVTFYLNNQLRFTGIQRPNCIGSSKQYLTTQIPYGIFDQPDQGGFLCRAPHSVFTPLIQNGIDPSGGYICTDETLDFHYNQSDYLSCAHRYR